MTEFKRYVTLTNDRIRFYFICTINAICGATANQMEKWNNLINWNAIKSHHFFCHESYDHTGSWQLSFDKFCWTVFFLAVVFCWFVYCTYFNCENIFNSFCVIYVCVCFYLQNIPQFLPVMRGTVSLPANRDPEVLERLHPDHFKNMCNRMEVHLNASATQVGNEQAHITAKMKEVGFDRSIDVQHMTLNISLNILFQFKILYFFVLIWLT